MLEHFTFRSHYAISSLEHLTFRSDNVASALQCTVLFLRQKNRFIALVSTSPEGRDRGGIQGGIEGDSGRDRRTPLSQVQLTATEDVDSQLRGEGKENVWLKE